MSGNLKTVVSVRLSDSDMKRSNRSGRPMADQIRYDIAMIAALERLNSEGMSDRPLGAMLELAKDIIKLVDGGSFMCYAFLVNLANHQNKSMETLTSGAFLRLYCAAGFTAGLTGRPA